mmetsp:Transcript_23856/g.50289  ORF Transcript_23856/g.50289 Transcript_23856/m.50289 type:complete len:161 (+) Transcript_23856:183-665(+)
MTKTYLHLSPSKSTHHSSKLPPLIPVNVKKRYRFDYQKDNPTITVDHDKEIPRFFPSSWSLLQRSCEDTIISQDNSSVCPVKSKKPKMLHEGEEDTSQESPCDAFSSSYYSTTELMISNTNAREAHRVFDSPPSSSYGTRSKRCIDLVSMEDIPPLPFGP